MNQKELFDKLVKTYTQSNLNKITSDIVSAYRAKNHTYLHNLKHYLRDILGASSDSINKLFSKLIVLYHPDRLAYYQKELQKQYALGATGNLAQFTHIFHTLEYIATKAVHISAPNAKLFHTEVQEYYDFKSALKHKEYGNLDVIYQDHDFVQIEGDLELSGYRIDDLSGIELCIHLITLDLSNNEIFDITNLRFLHLLEELDLSYNKVHNIDILSELHYLTHLDLAFNNAEDISSLLQLNRLEYVNVIGNNIPEFQINALKDKGVIIAH